MYKFGVYFQNTEVINYFGLEKNVFNLRCWFWYHIPQSKRKNHLKKTSTDLAEWCWIICSHVTPSAASLYSAVKLTPESYQFLVAH